MKGIAITSVVMGHCAVGSFTERFVNQFHLAVFFFVAGYFFKEEYVCKKCVFIKKRLQRLYFPFVISGVCFLILHPLLEKLYVYEKALTWDSAFRELFNLTIMLTSNDPMMGAMWFCPALLIVSLLSFVVFCITKGLSIKTRSLGFMTIVALGGGISTSA